MGNSGSSSLAGIALKVGAIAVAAGAASWALSVFSDSKDDQTPKYYSPPPPSDDDHQNTPNYYPPPADDDGRPTKEGYHADNQVLKLTPPDPHHQPRKIKLMCYNIWSVEVKLHERMEAIGKLIQKHSPDIILLQEVTPSIYKIFKDCKWWGSYECSVPPEKATRKFFCMLNTRCVDAVTDLHPLARHFYSHWQDTN